MQTLPRNLNRPGVLFSGAETGSRPEDAAVMAREPVVAVLVPCYNEEHTVGRVVEEFRAALPLSTIYVYDNQSSDGTSRVAKAAGAIVRTECARGKGHVVRRMFADVDADIYVLVDGDATYDASSAPKMIETLLDEQLDMVVGCRVETDQEAYRPGHRLGNALLTGSVSFLFARRFTDMLSGYRVFSRRFVKSFPALAKGFEIETELTVHALELAMPVGELRTPYGARPDGSVSKLRTYTDGFKLLRLIVALYRSERPFQFFAWLSLVLAATAVILTIPLLQTYLQTGLVPRLPTAVLATGLVLMAALSLTCGLILDTVTRGRRELKRLAYLSLPILWDRFPHGRSLRSRGGERSEP